MRELIVFDGAVECRTMSGPVNWVLSGFERASPESSRRATTVHCGGASLSANVAELPPRLHAVRVYELEADAGSRRLLIRAAEMQLELQARSVQLHRDVAYELFTAVPSPPVPWRLRLGWALLLDMLCLPGVARLLLRRGDAA
jgi:hypothetical protein